MNMPAPGFYAPAADRYAHMPYVRCGRSGLKLPTSPSVCGTISAQSRRRTPRATCC